MRATVVAHRDVDIRYPQTQVSHEEPNGIAVLRKVSHFSVTGFVCTLLAEGL